MQTFVISEVGLNHEGNFQKAKDLIYASKCSNADAVKLQTYQTHLRVNKDNPFFDLLKKCELSYEQHADLKKYADDVGVDLFSTPFDVYSLKFLIDELNIRKIKIASFDVSNTVFLEELNNYGKRIPGLHVILSVGMSNVSEILKALKCLESVPKITVMHCVSSYPTKIENVNLSEIISLKNLFRGSLPVGYSDHTPDIRIPALSVLVGANAIEKHFTLDKKDTAVDNPVSADPKMFKEMVNLIREYELILGDGDIRQKQEEEFAIKMFKRIS